HHAAHAARFTHSGIRCHGDTRACGASNRKCHWISNRKCNSTALSFTKALTTASPPPLWGRDRERGNEAHRVCCYPPPQPSHTRGEGADRVCCQHSALHTGRRRSRLSLPSPPDPPVPAAGADRSYRGSAGRSASAVHLAARQVCGGAR